jgi:chromosomal replication initiator protein
VASQDKTVHASKRSLTEAQKLWQAVLGELQLQMTRATFDTWLRGSRAIDFEDNALTVHVDHAYAVDWLQNRLLPIILRTLRRHAGPDVDVLFTARGPEPKEHYVFVAETVPEEEESSQRSTWSKRNGHNSDRLIDRYTFDTFVVGASNRLAHAASLAVAENPAHAYNPLFIYGGVGLGKTHLLHALGHVAEQRGQSVLCVSAECFTNDLIQAIRNNTTNDFREKYRTNDVLLIDDIQFIVGKERTQEEFFHTFNALHSTGKQVVVTCDRPPKALVALEDRLRSRFGWGLIADVQPPDFETRVAILRAKANGCSPPVPDEVLAYIARKIPSNIRELEGALTRVIAHANLMQAPMNIKTAETALVTVLDHETDLTPEQILTAVARHFNISEEDLIGRSRRRAVSEPRQLAMYLIREETHISFPAIGEMLGKRDHTTILHGCEKIAAQIETDPQLRRDWLAIKGELSQRDRDR